MADNSLRTITWEEYSKHTNPQDCWVMIQNIIYNVSDYLVEHPGGDDILVKQYRSHFYRYSGLDGTERFNLVNHSKYALSLRNARVVGKIQSSMCTQEYKLKLQKIKKGNNSLKSQLKEHTKDIIKLRQNILRNQVAQHNKQTDCWVIIQNGVYDLTKYMSQHPGGQSVIMHKAGGDATKYFQKANHSLGAIQKRKSFLIGYAEPAPTNMTKYIIIVILALIAFTIIADITGVVELTDLWDL